MSSYEYRIKTNSYLSPSLEKYIIDPMLNRLSWGLPANIITIISNCFFYLAFYLSIHKEILGKTNFLVIPILFATYIIGGQADRTQAKRTNTSSALGEFIDHYLDAINSGLLIYIIFSLFNISELWLLGVTLFSAFAALAGVHYEQFKSGWFVTGRVGYIEIVLLSALLILLSYFDPVYNLMVSAIIDNLSILMILLGLIALGGLIKFIATIKRVDHVTYGIWLFIVLLGITTVFGVLLFNVFQLSLLITLYAGWYVGKLMTAHLVDGIERSTGLFTPLILIVVYFLESLESENTFFIITAYLLINIFLLVYRNISSLRKDWMQKNSEESD